MTFSSQLCTDLEEDGGFEVLPTNLIYSRDLSGDLNPVDDFTSGWSVKEASGEIHPGSFNAAFITLEDGETVYMFGGMDEKGEYCNTLSTLSSTGRFKRIHPNGEVPPPTTEASCWSHNGRIYIFGGLVHRSKSYDGLMGDLVIAE